MIHVLGLLIVFLEDVQLPSAIFWTVLPGVEINPVL